MHTINIIASVHISMSRNEERLFALAERQQGFFTSAQAVECGYPTSNHGYHMRARKWERVGRGVYRLMHFPRSPEDQYVLWSLWSRGRGGEPQGVFSHQTALSIYELSDVMPVKLHLTVPLRFRRSVATPKVLVLHRADLRDDDIETRQAYGVVRPLRAITDLLREGVESQDHLRQALKQGLERGLITQTELRQHHESATLQALLGRSPA